MVGGAVICSVLTLCCVKYVTILTSSIVGTAMILSAIDFFTHGLETINWVSQSAPHVHHWLVRCEVVYLVDTEGGESIDGII